MTNRLQEILSKAEILPPQSAWEKIQHELDTEFDPNEAQLAEKLFFFESEPPSLIWQNIAAGLVENPQEEKQPARIIDLPFKRLAVAAIAIGIISMTAFYIFRTVPGNITDKVNSARVTAAIKEIDKGKISPANTISIPSSSLLNASRLIKMTPRHKKNVDNDEAENNTLVTDDQVAAADHADPNDLEAAKVSIPIDVSAPPIRDGNGNLILDASVISSPDKEYITVTAPNGEQTRLSSKFLSVMRVLNSNSFSSRNDQWKKTLEEWRSRVMSEGAFIPASTNFLDIFELKEIIQDN